jgi:dTDP-L-rhamnose 4-epimerase
VRILVTGAAGFVGSHIVDALIEVGHEVVAIDSLMESVHSEPPEYLNPAARFVAADLRDSGALDPWIRDVDAVSHQAAMVGLEPSFADAPDYVSHNGVGTAALLSSLDAAGFAGQLVLASSMVVYGEGAYECSEHGDVRIPPRRAEDLKAGRYDPPCPHCGKVLQPAVVEEDRPVDPRNVYAATKLHQEHLCTIFGRVRAVPVTALRYHNIYGDRMPFNTPYAGVASIFRSVLERGEAPRVFEDGRQLRDFISVEDVARANIMALTAAEPPVGPFNIATGEPHSVGEMAEVLADAMNGPAPVITGGWRAGDVRHVFASPRRAEETLGWRAQVPFAEGMQRFATQTLRGAP